MSVRLTRLLLFTIVAAAIGGCATAPRYVTPTFHVQSLHKSFLVAAPDNSIVVQVPRIVGELKQGLDQDDACFANHDYGTLISLITKVGFAPAPTIGTRMRLLNESESQVRDRNGEISTIENQRLKRIGRWDVLIFRRVSHYEFEGEPRTMTGHCVLGLTRVNDQLVTIEMGLFRTGEFDQRYEDEVQEILARFKLKSKN